MERVDYVEPAKSIIAKCGGPDAVARVTGKSVTRVYRWMYPKANGGSDGVIPHREAKKLLSHASASGIDLTANDFFPADQRELAS